jgi:hypothetical protein
MKQAPNIGNSIVTALRDLQTMEQDRAVVCRQDLW